MRNETSFGSSDRSSSRRATRDDPELPILEQDGLPIFHDPIDASLTPQQCAAISHLISGRTFSTTATLIGVSRKTVYNWRQIPAFRNALQSLSRESCQAAAMRVRNILLRGTRKLEKLVEGHLSLADTLKIVSNKRVWDIANAIEASLVGPEQDEGPSDPMVDAALAEIAGRDDPAAQQVSTDASDPSTSQCEVERPVEHDAGSTPGDDSVLKKEIDPHPTAPARDERDTQCDGGIRVGNPPREEPLRETIVRDSRTREEKSFDPTTVELLSRLAADCAPRRDRKRPGNRHDA